MSGTIRYTIRPYDTIWMLAQVFNTTVDSIMELNPGIDPRKLQVGQVITIMPGYQYYPSYTPANQGPTEEMQNNMENDTDNVMADDMMDEMDECEMCDLIVLFRMLWEQHVQWTREAVMGIIHDLPETDLIVKRLLRNPTDFANVLRMYYGDEAAKNFADLLTGHLTIAADLVKAAKAGDTNAVSAAENKWFENASQIADFLGSINPYWNTEDWNAMLDEHLQLLRDNALDMLAQNYEKSINGFDEIEAQALEMADVMAEGIAMQFPA